MIRIDLGAVTPLVVTEAKLRDDIRSTIKRLSKKKGWRTKGLTRESILGHVDRKFIHHAEHYAKMLNGGTRQDGSSFKGTAGVGRVAMEVSENTCAVVIHGSLEWNAAPHTYQTTIKFNNYDKIAGLPEHTWAEKARALMEDHMQVQCDCPAFQFYHARAATVKGFALVAEDRPAPKNNPKNKGGVCKHLEHALRYLPANYAKIGSGMKKAAAMSESVDHLKESADPERDNFVKGLHAKLDQMGHPKPDYSKMSDDELMREGYRVRALHRDWQYDQNAPKGRELEVLKDMHSRSKVKFDDMQDFKDHLEREHAVTVRPDGHIKFDTLSGPVRRMIGDNTVVLHHTTSSRLVPAIDKEGLRVGKPTNYATTGSGVYLDTDGDPGGVYGRTASNVHGGHPVTLTVVRRLSQLDPDPDDAHLPRTGRTQFITPHVPPEDVLKESNEVWSYPDQETVKSAKAFVLRKWKERAAERGNPEPHDLSSACKFCSEFAAKAFGGTTRGNWHHQHAVVAGKVLDLAEDSDEVRELRNKGVDLYKHDSRFWNNPEHKDSIASIQPRIQKWVTDFAKEHPGAASALKESVTENLKVHHGTSLKHAEDIHKNGVDLSKTSPGYFGNGFYTTEDEKLAKANYADFSDSDEGGGATVHAAVSSKARLLDLRKPEHWDKWSKSGLAKKLHLADFHKHAVAAGVDGLYDNSFQGWVFYNPKVLKVTGVTAHAVTENLNVRKYPKPDWGRTHPKKVMYHATAAEHFDAFDTSRSDLGSHFGTLEQANHIADTGRGSIDHQGMRIIPVRLHIKNPLRLKDVGSFHADAIAKQLHTKGIISRQDRIDAEAAGRKGRKEHDAKFRAAIEKAGYDGVVYKNTQEGRGDSYIAFRPEQIKSAIANSGKFDTTKVSMRESAEPFLRNARTYRPDPYDAKIEPTSPIEAASRFMHKMSEHGLHCSYDHAATGSVYVNVHHPENEDGEAGEFIAHRRFSTHGSRDDWSGLEIRTDAGDIPQQVDAHAAKVLKLAGLRESIDEMAIPHRNDIEPHDSLGYYGDDAHHSKTDPDYTNHLLTHGEYTVRELVDEDPNGDGSGDTHLWRAYHKGEAVANGEMWKHGKDKMYVEKVYVEPAHRGNGIPAAVLGHYAKTHHVHGNNYSAGSLKMLHRAFGDRLMTPIHGDGVVVPKEGARSSTAYMTSLRKLTDSEHAEMAAGGKVLGEALLARIDNILSRIA